jgi:hypothetical protein
MSPDNTMFGVPFEPMVLAILSAPTITGDASMEAGVHWEHSHPMPFLRGSSLTTVSTLGNVEQTGEIPVAVIRTQGEFRLDGTASGGVELGAYSEGNHSGRCLLHRLDFTWIEESDHRLSDGHRLRSTGRMIHDMVSEWVIAGPGGGEIRAPYALRIDYEFDTETDPRS